MPSLNELKEFKASFNNIGGQKAALAAKNIPFDDLELPDSEPTPLPAPVEEKPAAAAPAEEPAPEAADTADDFGTASGDGFDFSAFLGAQPQDLPDPPAPDIEMEPEPAPEPESPVEPVSPADAGQTAADLYAPEELLSNLSEELDAIPPDFPEESPPAESADSGKPPLDLDSLDNFDMPEDPEALEALAASGDKPSDLGSLDDFDMPEPVAATDSELGILHDTDMPEEPEPAAEPIAPVAAEASPDLGDLDSDPIALADEGESLDFDNFGDLDLPTESSTEAESRGSPLEPEASAEAETSTDSATPDLDDFGDLDMPSESSTEAEGRGSPLEDRGSPLDTAEPESEVSAEETNLDLGDLGDLDLPNEVETPDLDDLGDLDMPAESDAAPTDDASTGEGEDLDLGDLGDLDMPTDTAEPEAEVSAEETNLDLGDLGDLDIPNEVETPDLGDLGDLDMPAESEAAASTGDGENLDLGDLGDLDIPNEVETPDLDDLGDLDMPSDAEAATSTDENLDLGDLGDLDMPAESEAAASTGDGENLDLGDLGDLDMPAEPEAASTDENLDLSDLGDLDMPSDESGVASTGEDLDLGDLGDLDMPAESEVAPTGEDLDLGDLGDLDMPSDESGAASTGEDLDLGDLGDLDEPSAPEEGEIDLGNFEDFETTEEPEAAADSSGGTGDDLDDFSFPELDNVLEQSAKASKAAEAPKGKGKGKGWGKQKQKKPTAAPAPDDVDEIQLSDDEFEGLQETLSRYPLNLRVACEEIIVERAVNPKQMSELIEHLVWGATAKETAAVASRILGRAIIIPKAFQKSTGAALEAEQASFPYIFVHKFLPILRLFLFIALVAASVFYLLYKFVYIPNEAEKLYRMGYERIFDGEYERANERFSEAFDKHRNKKWFYRYAEAFRDERQYIYAEQKYDELLHYYLRDKKGVLDYANLETYYLRNYAKADTILRNQLLDYAPNDFDGLLAAGDNCLLWAEVDPSKYEDARFHYARALDKYGWKAPVVERMMKYFIRTDNLKEVLPLKAWFDRNPKYELSAESLGELGGYLLDKKLEEVPGVPNEYVQYIDGIRDILLKAVFIDPTLPEPHYHLARYYQSLGNAYEERVTLRVAARAFNDAPEGSIRRVNYHIDTLQRYGDALINNREFMTAEEQLIKGINLYEDAVSRRLISRAPKYGKLYAGLGDLEYFTKIGDMEASLRYYRRAEQNGYAPPEMQYRMGAAYYQLEDWKNAMEYIYTSSTGLPLNRRVLFALGNASLKRGDYFAAQGYYNRLLDILETQRTRLPVLLPNDRPEFLEMAERLMMARNNTGVAYEMLSAQTGNRSYYSRALGFYAESNRAWDSLTRDPDSMIRSGSRNLAYLNTQNALYPVPGNEPQIFIRIDREAREDSKWEELAPLARLEHGLSN